MLSRRWIINYVLIFLIVLFTWIGNKYGVKPGNGQKPEVSALETADIGRLEVETADVSLSFERGADGWNIVAPISWPANNVNIERLLDIVDRQTDSRLDAEEIDLANLGLDSPKAMLRLNDTRVLFGATNNIGERRYTMIDSTVFLMPDIHMPFIIQGLPGLVDRRMLPARLGLAGLSLPGLRLERDAAGNWRAPEADFDGAQIEQLAGNWEALEASRIRDYRASGTPRQKIEAGLADGRRLEFFLMSIDPEIVIANPQIGLQYHFGREYYYQLISLRRGGGSG